tara:strand:- start:1158 stop:2096 length:939 start_codon:yes stop_codon:yes gene_type:complete
MKNLFASAFVFAGLFAPQAMATDLTVMNGMTFADLEQKYCSEEKVSNEIERKSSLGGNSYIYQRSYGSVSMNPYIMDIYGPSRALENRLDRMGIKISDSAELTKVVKEIDAISVEIDASIKKLENWGKLDSRVSSSMVHELREFSADLGYPGFQYFHNVDVRCERSACADDVSRSVSDEYEAMFADYFADYGYFSFTTTCLPSPDGDGYILDEASFGYVLQEDDLLPVLKTIYETQYADCDDCSFDGNKIVVGDYQLKFWSHIGLVFSPIESVRKARSNEAIAADLKMNFLPYVRAMNNKIKRQVDDAIRGR